MPQLKSISSLALLGALALTACGGQEEAADPRTGPPTVRVATAGEAMANSRVFTGIVTARVESDLGFRVPGKVVQRLVDTGQTVKAGQPLMRIDRTDYALAFDAIRAKAEQTAADERRYRDLVSAGAVSASAYDQIKAAADAAEAQMRAARNEASYSVLLADADGVVMQTLAEPGQVVAPGQTVVKLAHAGPREATISLPETLRPSLGSGARARLYGADADSGAVLRQLSDFADPVTRTFEAKYVLEGAAASAPLGATVEVSLPDNRSASGQQIPISALFDSGRGPGVWVVDRASSTLAWRPVQVIAVSDEAVTLAGGLDAGDRFVSLGAQLLRQGQKVKIAKDGIAQ